MKKALFASALLGVFGTDAMAADLPLKAPIMQAAPPAFSWTGCYLGGGGGYGLWNQDTFFETAPGHVQLTPKETAGGRGWFGTVQVGCDYQIAPSWVIGAQGDWDWGSLKGQNHFAVGSIGDETNSWTWAAGGRIGYVPIPQLLAYVSAGYTQAHFDQVNGIVDTVFPAIPSGIVLPAQTYNGWYLGSGYEYGFGWLPGVFWKTEYRYSSFSAVDLPHLAGGLPNGFATHSEKFIQTIRTELVWRFNWGGAPVMSRY